MILAVGIDAAVSLQNSIRPRGVVLHHSALPKTEDLAEIEALHKRRGFGIFYWWRIYRIGYHYIIRADGTVISIRPEHLRGAHALGANDMIGICVLGNFESSEGNQGPTADQMRSLVFLSRRLITKYRFEAADFHRHSDIDTYTVCPGAHFPFSSFMDSISG
jgi:N-acetylmuramoyl-L-alanine amidase